MLKTEAERMSTFLSKPISEFADAVQGCDPYVYVVKMRTDTGKCIFLMEKDCLIYPLRPLVCRFYPFEMKTTENGSCEFSPTKECSGVGRGKLLGKEFFESLFQLAKREFSSK
jgi:Fe-S-cluster containining protein